MTQGPTGSGQGRWETDLRRSAIDAVTPTPGTFTSHVQMEHLPPYLTLAVNTSSMVRSVLQPVDGLS